MARKRSNRSRPQTAPSSAERPTTDHPAKARTERPLTSARRPWPLIGAGLVVALLAVVGGYAILSGQLAGVPTGSADDGQGTAIVQGEGGQWREITVDDLDAMLAAKDFTLLNVKTPYVGEIDGTDLYVPYDQLAARADELPADKDGTLVVYCRSGNQSAIAAQTLLELGYTDIVNVDGGMVAWTDSGRELVQHDRS